MMKKIFIYLLLFYGWCTVCIANEWPEIVPVHKLISVKNPSLVKIDLPIVGSQGIVKYYLICRSGDYDDTSLFNFSGFLHCALFEASLKSGTLFRESNDTVGWENRGRFLQHHLLGKCGKIPQWGREREFKLRRMRIKLKVIIDNIDSQGFINAYKLDVEVSKGESRSKLTEAIKAPTEPSWFYKGHCD